jgi:hypothetical protein
MLVGIKLSISTTITATGESTVFSVPDPYIAFVKRLSISNAAASLATVQLIFYNGASRKVVLTAKVASGETVVFAENELPIEGCPTSIAISTDQQPINVEMSVELE